MPNTYLKARDFDYVLNYPRVFWTLHVIKLPNVFLLLGFLYIFRSSNEFVHLNTSILHRSEVEFLEIICYGFDSCLSNSCTRNFFLVTHIFNPKLFFVLLTEAKRQWCVKHWDVLNEYPPSLKLRQELCVIVFSMTEFSFSKVFVAIFFHE